MKFVRFNLLLVSLLTLNFLFAQTPVESRTSSSSKYAANQSIGNEKAAALDAVFDEMPVSMLKVHAMSASQESGEYLIEGRKIAGDYLDLFPAKYRRFGRRTDTDVYAGAAVPTAGDVMYIVRFVRGDEEKIELFKLVGETMRHQQTLAMYSCRNGNCKEVISYLTDIDMDGVPDIARLYRQMDKNNNLRKSGRQIFIMNDNGKYKRAKNYDLDPTMRNTFKF